MKKVLPTQDRVLVRRIESESKTDGGIIIPDSAKEKPVQGIIVAIGSGAVNTQGVNIPIALKVGQKILFTKWSGTEIKIDNEDLIIMKETDIIAILD